MTAVGGGVQWWFRVWNSFCGIQEPLALSRALEALPVPGCRDDARQGVSRIALLSPLPPATETSAFWEPLWGCVWEGRCSPGPTADAPKLDLVTDASVSHSKCHLSLRSPAWRRWGVAQPEPPEDQPAPSKIQAALTCSLQGSGRAGTSPPSPSPLRGSLPPGRTGIDGDVKRYCTL